MRRERGPRVDDDGRVRADCARCQRLMFRFLPRSLGELEKRCDKCKHMNVITFNGTETPEIR